MLYKLVDHILSYRLVDHRVMLYRLVDHIVMLYRLVDHRVMSYRLVDHIVISYRLVDHIVILVICMYVLFFFQGTTIILNTLIFDQHD